MVFEGRAPGGGACVASACSALDGIEYDSIADDSRAYVGGTTLTGTRLLAIDNMTAFSAFVNDAVTATTQTAASGSNIDIYQWPRRGTVVIDPPHAMVLPVVIAEGLGYVNDAILDNPDVPLKFVPRPPIGPQDGYQIEVRKGGAFPLVALDLRFDAKGKVVSTGQPLAINIVELNFYVPTAVSSLTQGTISLTVGAQGQTATPAPVQPSAPNQSSPPTPGVPPPTTPLPSPGQPTAPPSATGAGCSAAPSNRGVWLGLSLVALIWSARRRAARAGR